MRYRQSSVTIETQYPVRSIGAAVLGVCDAAGAPPRPPRPCARSPVCAASYVAATIANVFITSVFPSTAGLKACTTPEQAPRPALLLRQALVDRFDERARHTGLCAIPRFVRQRGARGFDLVERLALLHEIRHDIADQHDHVAVVDDLHLLAESAVAGNHVSAHVLIDERRGRNRKV